MIRKGILVSLAITGLLVALAWAGSFYSFDDRLDPASRLHCLYWQTSEGRMCFYVTSLRGWLRFGTVRVGLPSSPLPPLDDLATWVWLGSCTWPDPALAKTSLATAHLRGLVVTAKLRFDSGLIAGIALPHWLISLILLPYPTVVLIRGPLRRWRRRKRGLCPSCGYDLTGLPEPRCPECGKKFETPSEEDRE